MTRGPGAGAVGERSFLGMLARAGFVDAKTHGRTGYSTSRYTYGALLTAVKPALAVP